MTRTTAAGGGAQPLRRLAARVRLAWDTQERRPGFWGVILASALVLAALVSARIGAVRVPTADLWPALTDASHPLHALLWEVRIRASPAPPWSAPRSASPAP